MRINLNKETFTTPEVDFITDKLEKARKLGFIVARSENNFYLRASFRGVEEYGISHKWNVKIYKYGLKRGGHSIVCVDKYVLRKLVDEDYESFVPPDLTLLRIDDAGWGFPLCGVMVGVSDEQEVRTAVVPIAYFRHDTHEGFHTKRYLKEYASQAVQLMGAFEAKPETHRVEICTGYVNQPLRERLRNMGYDVRVAEIRGLLQQELEERYRQYVLEEIGADIYYDPKDIPVPDIPRRYRESLSYGRHYCPDKLKTGWPALRTEC